MTYAFSYEVPITTQIYARIKDGIGPQRPSGMIAHLAWRTEQGLRYVEVWQSKGDWEAFEHSRVHPVVRPPAAGDARVHPSRTTPHDAQRGRRMDSRPPGSLTADPLAARWRRCRRRDRS